MSASKSDKGGHGGAGLLLGLEERRRWRCGVEDYHLNAHC